MTIHARISDSQLLTFIVVDTIKFFSGVKFVDLFKVAPYSLELLSFIGVVEPFCIT